ncbi:MAG TPA: nucleotidyltransferase family protein [Candidatus Paceibacterota bacterium]|nr:nucleotidyltransferase family protein [Candidatus Paceibacterota bacterium]
MSLSPDQVTAVVLAGGFGTRIRHLLQDIPKPMAPVLGKPFIEWVVRYLKQHGITRSVLSTGYLAETVEKHFSTNPVAGVSVRCVPETTPLGTAGGFLNAAFLAKERTEAWLVLNGDSLALAPLEVLLASLNDPAIHGAILGVPMNDASRYGTLVQNEFGELAGFREKRSGAGIINAGVYLFRAALIETFSSKRPLSFETDVFPMLADRKVRLKVCVTEASFLDIGTPESLPQAEEFVRERAGSFSD